MIYVPNKDPKIYIYCPYNVCILLGSICVRISQRENRRWAGQIQLSLSIGCIFVYQIVFVQSITFVGSAPP